MSTKTEQKIIKQCNDLLRTELGGVFQREGRNVGQYSWVNSDDKKLQFFVRSGHKEVEQNGVIKLVPEYKKRSILPDGPEFHGVWVMCYSDSAMSEDEWLARFGTEIQQITYWRPVIVDSEINTYFGRDVNPRDLIKYVTLPRGIRPDLEVTNKFIALIKEARSIAKEETRLRAEAEARREEKLKQDRRDFMKSYALGSFPIADNGERGYSIVPGTIAADGTIKEANELAERNKILRAEQ